MKSDHRWSSWCYFDVSEGSNSDELLIKTKDRIMTSLLALITILMAFQVVNGEDQTVNAFGCVYCNGDPLKNITVKMYDIDPIVDTLMGQTVTDRDGCFFVNGTASDWRSDIDPVINFYHECPMRMDFGICLLKSRLFLDAPEVVDKDFVNLTDIEVSDLVTTKDCLH
nr:Transthyretin domain containing protein [Haemonchus contortus]